MISKHTSAHEHYHIHSNKRISWTAIFVGALTALGLGFLLNLFGGALILSTLKPMSNGSTVLVVIGMLVLILGTLCSMFAAGYTSGYLGRLYCPEGNLGGIYGFTTWAMALLLGAILIGVFSQYIATYTNLVANTVVVASSPPVNQIKTPVGTTSITAPTQKGEKAVVEIDVVTTNLASSSFILFTLFFLGAIFTCLGANSGMRCKRDD